VFVVTLSFQNSVFTIKYLNISVRYNNKKYILTIATTRLYIFRLWDYVTEGY